MPIRPQVNCYPAALRERVHYAVCLVVLSCMAPIAGADEGKTALPGGWIRIEKEGLDTVRGAYHDSVSGTFVRTELASETAVADWATSRAARNGLKVQENEGAGFRVRRVAVAAPAKGCEEGVVSFLREGISWNLAALVCNDLQRQRFNDLVADLPVRFGGWPPLDSRDARSFQEAELSTTNPGMHWTEVRQRLGPPNDAVTETGGGFAVAYDMGRKQARLVFDQEQRLKRVEIY